MTMVGSLLIALLALIMDFLLGFFEKRISSRSIKAKKTNRIIAIVVCLLCLCMAIGTLFPVNRQDTIHIATKPMTEQYVLGEMLDILIEQETDLNVELTQGVGGGTSNIKPAMESGEFDIYPEYTGTAWNMVLKKDSLYSEQNMISLSGKMDMMLFVTLMVSHSKKTMDMDIGLKYQAINEGKIDVMVIFTTDGQLSVSDVTVLEDDKNFYPSYLCGNVIRSEVLEEHPELAEIFNKLTGVISDKDMAQMNYAVESEGKEPREVAETFLRNANL